MANLPVITEMNSEIRMHHIVEAVLNGAEVERKRLSQNSLLLDDDLEQKLAYTVAEGLQEK
ncbi:hypothetical protein T09_14357 [Trichinella sp. T9]|uniref:Uncharacterized protein n=1 Tax=Trichinella murrelli TaxID=144512 RepID=A0A0V0T9W7_9BILA|nr:hypothetical protein T05_671 [Trichinella murrelli]KRX64547.1 hypothetical protein T09_14357 [Trichinella sp. T9]